MDGGGEDVYEKNEIISVVTTKKEDARLVTIIDLFAHRLVSLKQTRGLGVKNRLTGTKGRTSTALQCVSCTEVERILLKFYVFPPCESRLFFFYCWISHTRRGEVKTKRLISLHVSGGWEKLHDFDGVYTDTLF